MLLKIIIGGLIGGLVGFAIGYFGNCASGLCPLTSNPAVSAITGILLGIFLIISK